MAETIGDVGEFGLIRRIDAIVSGRGRPSGRAVVGIGDDAASFLPRPGYEVLVTCDAMVEGRHYLPGAASPFDLGCRAMALNISDIGAMGGTPLFALVSLGLKGETPVAEVEEMYRGFLAELDPFRASIIGGNLTKSDGPAFIDVTLIGEVERGKGVRRSGASPGDAILVTGYPGQSAAGLGLLTRATARPPAPDHPLVRAYNRPVHRALLGAAIGGTGLATAMIDTSDGFLGDLGHICEESRVGAEIAKGRIPLSAELREAAAVLGEDPYAFFLGDSDDYELVVTCRPADAPRLLAVASERSVPMTEVGRIVSGEGITLLLPDGKRQALRAAGWDHFHHP